VTDRLTDGRIAVSKSGLTTCAKNSTTTLAYHLTPTHLHLPSPKISHRLCINLRNDIGWKWGRHKFTLDHSVGTPLHEIIHVPAPLKSGESISLLINNSVAHLPIVFKFGRLVRYEITETKEFEHPLPIKSKMTESGLKCKNNLVLRSHSHPQLSFRNGARYVKC